MSSTWEELRFYGSLASTLMAPRYDLARVPGPRGHPVLGNITAGMRPDYHVQVRARFADLLPKCMLLRDCAGQTWHG